MRGFRSRPGLALLCSLALSLIATSGVAHAQIQNGNLWPHPRLLVLTPCGGKVGSTFEVAFNGTETDHAEALVFTHPGISAKPVPPPAPDPKAKPDPNKKEPQVTKFTVTIGKEVPLGYYDVRLLNKHGLSNPRVFVVGDLNEVAEKEPNNDVGEAQRVEIGTTISGAIAQPTDVDYTVFPGKKGQRLLIRCLCASIDSKLVPEIQLYSAAGTQIGYERGQPGQDALLHATLPADGDYLIRLSQFTYTGGSPEHYYRLDITAGPWLDAVFPPIVEAGKTTQVTLYGRNLPGGQTDPAVSIEGRPLEKLSASVQAPPGSDQLGLQGHLPPTSSMVDGFEYRFTGPTGSSNPRLIAFATAPVVLENDDNDSADKAQLVNVPCEVAGRVDKKRDRDWYAFQAKKGQVLSIELLSHRLGAPTDMYLSVRGTDAKKEMALLDDPADNSSLAPRLYTQHRDPPTYRFVAPEDGKYHLLAASHTADTLADPQHVYVIRITPEKPDFRLVVMPADDHRPDAVTLGQGGEAYYTVFAERRDNFKGDITLTMEGLPPGVTCPPQVLGGHVKHANLVVSAADGAAPFTGAVKVMGTAVIAGQKVVHQARPATITWPTQPNQNIPTVTRLDRELILSVRDKAVARLTPTKDKVTVVLGEKVDVPLKLHRIYAEFKGNLQVQPAPNELPQGLNFGNVTFDGKKDEDKVVIQAQPPLLPGVYNVVLRGFSNIAPPDAKGKPVNTIVTATPVELTVLPKQVANLSVDNGNPAIKAGAEAPITVRVNRLLEYGDAFKVELVLPKDAKEAKGISAERATIAPGSNDAKLILRVPQGTPPGNVPNLVVRATATLYNTPIVHETKINVNVTK